MKLSKVSLYLLILAALAAYVYFVEIRHKGQERSREEKAEKLIDLDKEKIVHVGLITAEKGNIELEKPGEHWVMTAPVRGKADAQAIEGLLNSITQGKREKLIQDKDVDWKEFGLDRPEFTVDLATKDKKTRIFFGAKNPAKTSYYVRVDDDPRLLLVADTLKNSVNKTAFDLRDKTVVAIAPEDVDRLVIVHEGKETELKRQTSDAWEMVKPEVMKAKSSLVEGSIKTITGLKATQIIDNPVKDGDEYGLAKPETSIVLAGPKLEQTLLVGKAVSSEKDKNSQVTPDRYARVAGRDTVYAIDGRTVKNLKIEPDALRDRSLFALVPTDIEKFELELEGTTWAAARGKDNKWDLEKPEKKDKIETWPVTGLLWTIKDIAWKSIIRPAPENLASVHLDKPRLVAAFWKKGEKDPTVFKAGWEKTAAPAADTKAADKPSEEKKATSEEKEAKLPKPPADESDQAPQLVNATVQPHWEKDAIFVLDGAFIKRLRDGLKRLAEKEK